MVVPTTAISFFLSCLGLCFCGIRFFKAFQKIGGPRTGNRIGILLSTFFLATALQHGILALGSLWFADNPEALYITFTIDNIVLLLATALGVYLTFYILSPTTSPWPAVTGIFVLGVTVIISTIAVHPLPFINVNGGMEWNIPRWLSVILSYLIFLNIAPLPAIFIPAFLCAKSREVKSTSLVIIILSLLGIMNVSFRFLFPVSLTLDLRTRIFDIILAGIGLVLIVAFLPLPILIGLITKIQGYFGQKKDGGRLS